MRLYIVQSSMLVQYTFDDYDQAKTMNAEDASLPEDIIQEFETLYKLVEEYVATLPPITSNEYTQYDKKKHRKHYKQNRKYDNNPQWASKEQFKATKMEKKEGIEAKYSELTSMLNKITMKNRDTLLPKIMEVITYIMNGEEDDEDDEEVDSYENVINVLFDVAKKMRGGHDVYIIVLKELFQQYPSFITKISKFMEAYKNSYDNIRDIDANRQYDEYCDMVKMNDYRRTNSNFIVKLAESKFIDENELLAVIEQLFDKVLHYIDEEEQTVLIEEITENLSIFMTSSYRFLHSHSQWSNLIDKLNKCIKLKAKEHKSISSRIVFKYMDIQDALKKMYTRK